MTTLRPLSHADIPAHVALLTAVEAADSTDEHYSADELREEYDNPEIELGADIVGAFDGDALVGYFATYPRVAAGSHVKVHVEGTVHPDHRGRGLGTTLTAAMIARADAAHAAQAPELPARFTTVGLTDNTEQRSLLTAAMLQPERWSFTMRAQLAEVDPAAPPPSLPAGLTVRTWSADLDEPLRAAHNDAFLDHPDFTPWTEVMWHQWVSGSRTFRPELSLVVVRDDDPGRVVAYVQSNEFDAHFAATGRREAHVARVGSRREVRGRGVASALLAEALRRFRAAGFDEASLEVDSANPTGALGVYERAGFAVERRWTNYGLDRPPVTGTA